MAGPRDARGCAVTASPGVAGDGARNKAGCRPDQNAVRAIIGQPVRSPINRQLAVRIFMHPHRRLDEVGTQPARRQLQAQPLPLYRVVVAHRSILLNAQDLPPGPHRIGDER
jgi:hypothetical protein